MKSFFESGENGRVRADIVSKLERTFVKNMKGRTEGRTLNAHAEMPSREHWMYFAGEMSIFARKNKTRPLSATF